MSQTEEATVGQQVYDRIRNDVIFGGLQPGERLKLEPLKAKYDTSVTTLREVLNRLASEGFVKAEDQKGFSVSRVSLAGLRDVANLRKLLECHALVESVEHGDLDWEGKVVSAHHKLASIEDKMIGGETVDLALWKHFDREFHVALISACSSSTLLFKMHGDVFDHYMRYQMYALGFRGRQAANEHLTLMQQALARQPSKAVATLEKHIDNGVEHAATRGQLAKLKTA
jgi:DNA-binding GntR family transcriptional regulator